MDAYFAKRCITLSSHQNIFRCNIPRNITVCELKCTHILKRLGGARRGGGGHTLENQPWPLVSSAGLLKSLLRSFICFLTLTNSGGQNKLCKFNNLLIFYEGILWFSKGWPDGAKPPIKSKYQRNVKSSKQPCLIFFTGRRSWKKTTDATCLLCYNVLGNPTVPAT